MPKKVTILHDKPAFTNKAFGIDGPIREVHEGQDEDLILMHRPPYRVISRYYLDAEGNQVTETFPTDGPVPANPDDVSEVPFELLPDSGPQPEAAEEKPKKGGRPKTEPKTEPKKVGRNRDWTAGVLEAFLTRWEAAEAEGVKQYIFAKREGLGKSNCSTRISQAKKNRRESV